jgi:hypothetical protein
MNQTEAHDTKVPGARSRSDDPILCVSPAMISAIPAELIWLTVIAAMVMAGFLAATPE